MNAFIEAEQYHAQVERLAGLMSALARRIAKARYHGDLALADQLESTWELYAERKAIALDNEIACRELYIASVTRA